MTTQTQMPHAEKSAFAGTLAVAGYSPRITLKTKGNDMKTNVLKFTPVRTTGTPAKSATTAAIVKLDEFREKARAIRTQGGVFFASHSTGDFRPAA